MTLSKEVKDVIAALNKAGFEAYAVGGCVRDFILGREPYDWDITTNAKPEEIQKIFPSSVYENQFGTVAVRTADRRGTNADKRGEIQRKSASSQHKSALDIVEITTYRVEEKYTDKRHPDSVKFTSKLEDDLARRDFTINAIAYDGKKFIDPYGGQKDIENKVIRTVGDPDKRFNEDALRLMRAVRFSVQLGFAIEPKTAAAIKKNSNDLVAISKERVRDEFEKILMSKDAKNGVEMLREFGLLKHFLPELEEGYGVGQNKHHIYTVWEHNLLALQWAAENDYKLENRVAALLHDVGKPRVKKGEGFDSTFYNHEVVGAKMTAKILERLKFSKKFIEKIVLLVRYHLFYYNVEEVTESSVRRLVKNVGPENIDDLLEVRMADRKGSGVPKAEPYKLRHLRYLIEKVSKDPLSVKMLAVRGDDVMEVLGIEPGPKVGYILNILMGDVLTDPKKNEKEFLHKEIKRLGVLADNELALLAKKAEQEKQKLETKRDEMTKSKYWVT